MKNKDVLEHNVSSLLETGGEPPRIADGARARIRTSLVAQFGVDHAPRSFRKPIVAAFIGVLAAAALALFVWHGRGRQAARPADGTLADGSTFVTAPGGKLTVLGPRHVRVDGQALLDVVPGKGTFTVDTARGTVEVLGTRFYVDGQPERTTAAVVRGEVELATDQGSVVLHAGEQGIAERGRAPVREPAPRLSQLVAWSREARPAEQVAPVHHGTLFARDPGLRSHPPWGHEYPLPIAKLGVDVVIQDRVARVALDQTFHNDAPEELEGVYRFAIPPDAALQRLAMYVDGKLEESAVVERMQARRIYEELVYRRVDPALLEWAGNGRLSLRIYPIHANSDKRVLLAYTQSLPELYDDWTLTVPLPEVDRPVGELDATVRVAGCAGCELSSTSHAINVEKSGDDAIVHVHQTSAKTGDSLVLRVRDPRHVPIVATHA
ncbi:MAG: VIT domain-containing protein, partial [Acidobacteriota bacterium]